MEVLGVGPLELFFILIIALILLGPRDMVKAGRTLGKYMRMIVMSPTWRMVQQTSRDIRTLPNRLIREAGMEEDLKDLDRLSKDVSNQIGSLRKPFSAAANEALGEVKQAQAGLSEPGQEPPSMLSATPVQPTVQSGLAAWTTPPSSANPETQSVAEPEPGTEIKNRTQKETGVDDPTSDSTDNPSADEP